ncbi:MAG: NAD(P)/FAD-dependent oxidoreductase [Woeseiaceae bacterium]|nr:NAD(P)/FAD-dependent oxidoreductase [Woeseiaceae bacterium]
MSPHVDILGAGQCGALLATMLAGRGFAVDVWERSPDPRAGGAPAGRSINLALAARGINALERIGVLDRIRPLLVPMRGRMVHEVDGATEFLPYGQREGEQIYSVSRGHLNRLLLDVAEDAGDVTLHFGQRVTGYDADRAVVTLHDVATGSDHEIAANPVFAADGAGSAVRHALDAARGIGATEDLLPHGYKELTIPAGPGGEFRMEPNALHIWPRGGFMLIALPNPGGDFTLTLFLPNEGEPSFAELTDEAAAARFLERWFPDAVELIDEPAHALVANPLGLLGTVRCNRWHDGGNVLLIGDAAHAVVPFHGQGMNLAFEDCIVLERILDDTGPEWSEVFPAYERVQLKNANAIADMALENYVEMRDTVRDPRFALQKELAFELERRLPGRFIPRYSMVMFHAEIPYSVAKKRGAVQSELLDEFTRGAKTLADIDIDTAIEAVEQRLPPLNELR